MLRRGETADGAPAGERPGPPVFYRSVREFLALLPGVSQRFWLLVVATGVVSGVGRGAPVPAPRPGEERRLGRRGDRARRASPWRRRSRRVVVPALGGLLVTVADAAGEAAAGRPRDGRDHRGHLGAPGPAPAADAPCCAASSRSWRSAMGASLGREGALVQTGAAAGSWLADRFHVTRRQARLLVACGAASGIAAAYNVPIGGALFGLEVLLGSFALELFGPVVVSMVTATIIARVIAGQRAELRHPSVPAHASQRAAGGYRHRSAPRGRLRALREGAGLGRGAALPRAARAGALPAAHRHGARRRRGHPLPGAAGQRVRHREERAPRSAAAGAPAGAARS